MTQQFSYSPSDPSPVQAWTSRADCQANIVTCHVKMTCEDLQGGNPTACPVPVVHHPQGIEMLPDVQSEPPVPVVSCPSSEYHSKESVCVFFTAPLQIFMIS